MRERERQKMLERVKEKDRVKEREKETGEKKSRNAIVFFNGVTDKKSSSILIYFQTMQHT